MLPAEVEGELRQARALCAALLDGVTDEDAAVAALRGLALPQPSEWEDVAQAEAEVEALLAARRAQLRAWGWGDGSEEGEGRLLVVAPFASLGCEALEREGRGLFDAADRPLPALWVGGLEADFEGERAWLLLAWMPAVTWGLVEAGLARNGCGNAAWQGEGEGSA